MQFLIDIFVYASFACIMSFLAWMSCKKNGYESQRLDLWLWMYILFFTFISAIRWNVGVDSPSYFIGFTTKDLYTGTKDEEQLWGIWQNFIYSNGISPVIGLAGGAFVQIFFTTEALKKYRRILIMLPFVLFGSRYFLDYSNAVRQMMAASIFLWGTQFIIKRDIIKYILTIFFASLFHHSALGLIVIYFIPFKIDTTKHRWYWIAILAACLFMGQVSVFKGIGNNLNSLMLLLGYERYEVKVAEMLSSGYDQESLSFGPIMISFFAIALLIIWYTPKIKDLYGKYIPQFDLWYLLSNIYICLYFLVCNISHLFLRPIMYLELFQMIMATLLLLYLSRKENRGTIIAFIFYIIISISCIWNTWKAQGKSFESATYKTILTYPYKTELHHFR